MVGAALLFVWKSHRFLKQALHIVTTRLKELKEKVINLWTWSASEYGPVVGHDFDDKSSRYLVVPAQGKYSEISYYPKPTESTPHPSSQFS
jgi:hypothetical protein